MRGEANAHSIVMASFYFISSLYSNNISKFLLSMGPQTTKVKDHLYIDHEDEAVRGMLAVEKGKLMWPAPLPPPPVAKKEDNKPVEPEVIDYRAPYVQGAKQAGYVAAGVLGEFAVWWRV